MRRWIVRLLVVAAVVALGVGLRYWFLRPKPVKVKPTTVGRGIVEQTITNTRAGTVKAHHSAGLSPEFGGIAYRVPYEQGDEVKRGDILLRLDDSLQRAQLTLAQRDLQAAESRRNQACIQADRQDQELERTSRLAADKVVSEDVRDAAKAAAEAARSACEAARSDVERARAAVGVAQVELAKRTLRAPFDGVIADISVEVGEWTSPSLPALPIPAVISLIDPDSIYVSAPMDEVDAAKLAVGQRVRVTVDSHRGEEFWGTVSRVAPFVLDVEAQNRTVEIEVELDDHALARTLKTGVSADVEVVLETHDNVIRVPTSALFEGNQVLRIEGDRLRAQAVEVGLKNWNWTEITSGLAEGDRIVATLDRPEIKDGALVELDETPGSTPAPRAK